MASTDLLYSVTPGANYYIGSNPATVDFDGDVMVLDFDAGTDEFAEFMMFLPSHYVGSTGITFSVLWSADTATSNDCIWNIAISSLTDDTDNAGSKAFSSVNAKTDTAPGTAGIIAYATITFTNGPDMDSWATGEWAKVRLSRDADNVSDNMTGDAQFHALVMTET